MHWTTRERLSQAQTSPTVASSTFSRASSPLPNFITRLRRLHHGDAKKPKCAEHIEVHAQMGAAYVLDLVSSNASEPIELVRPNSVNILWQVPQLFVVTVGEILLSVTGLEFSYSQAAPSMKSVVQA
uniref:Uncharacterized protein n=1 Tax=Globodera pallida TaxID=36090 RepID=A0A183CDQ3_GLOPA